MFTAQQLLKVANVKPAQPGDYLFSAEDRLPPEMRQALNAGQLAQVVVATARRTSNITEVTRFLNTRFDADYRRMVQQKAAKRRAISRRLRG